jgi:hypothetical protein
MLVRDGRALLHLVLILGAHAEEVLVVAARNEDGGPTANASVGASKLQISKLNRHMPARKERRVVMVGTATASLQGK